MWLTRISIQQPVFATMLMLALAVLGLFSYHQLNVEEFPDVKFPIVVISTEYKGASPEVVESDISRKLEEAVNTLAGIKQVVSRSYQGSSVVIAEFTLSTDPVVAAQDVRDKVAQVKAGFRKEISEPVVSRYNPDEAPIISIAVTSPNRSLRELTTLADQLIIKRLQTAAGVGKASLVGGVKREIQVRVLPVRLQALGIGVDQVVSILQSENRLLPAGYVSDGRRQQMVEIRARLVKPEDFRQLVVAWRHGAPVYLAQVAEIIDGEEEQQSLALVNGKPALSIDLIKITGGNTVQVADNVRQLLQSLKAELPPDVQLQLLIDRSEGIRVSVADVWETLLEGAILTILIVFLFLGSWRSTVITGLTLPIALLGTVFALKAMGFSINVLTLMALSLSIGLLIDDAIVVRENIVRHVTLGLDHRRAALVGTKEIGLAVLATTSTIVAVFLPVGFMGGMIGKFFYQFGLTVAVSVLISMFVSFSLDPMLSAVWHDPHIHGMAHQGGVFGRLLDRFERSMDNFAISYSRLIAWCLRHRRKVLLLAGSSLVASFALVPLLGSEFVPEPEIGEIQVSISTPTGSALAHTAQKVQQVQKALSELPDVSSSYAVINTGMAQGKNNASVLVLVHPKAQRQEKKYAQLVKIIRQRLLRIAGIEVNGVQVGNNATDGKPVQISLQGQDTEQLQRLSEQLLARLRPINGLVDLESNLKAPSPSLAVIPNRTAAASLGVDVNRLDMALRPWVAGDEATTWKDPSGENYIVRVQLPPQARQQVNDLQGLWVSSQQTDPITQSPRLIALNQVADVQPVVGAAQINRRALLREVQITANVSGRSVGDVNADIEAIKASLVLPPGYRFQSGGASQDMAESLGYALSALALAVIFIYMILASQFGSFIQPLAIMMSLPLSLIGVFIALFIAGSTLNIFSIIGIIMLMGLVTKNAILLVDFVNQAQRAGQESLSALMEAGRVRLRPILMTTFAMVFGMLPLALGLGEGGAQRSSMGQAVIGGVMTSTLLTLVVVPVVYSYLASWRRS